MISQTFLFQNLKYESIKLKLKKCNFSFSLLLFEDILMIIQLLMKQNNRKIEGDGSITRSQEWEYINTVHIPHDRSIKAVGYYTRRKKQLKRNPSNEIIINLTNRNAERLDLKNHIETLFKSSKTIDPFITNYIKEIRVKPVINLNKFTNFNEELYKIKEDEKVKVVQQRYFSLQNYYNYLLDLKHKKEISRFVIDQESTSLKFIKDNYVSSVSIKLDQSRHPKESFSYIPEQEIHKTNERKDKKLRGFYETRFHPQVIKINTDKLNTKRSSEPTEKEINFEQNQSSYNFNVRQGKRIELSNK